MKVFFFLVLTFLASGVFAQKKFVLSPFQANIQKCIDKNIDIKKIDSIKKLYENISQFYALSSFETLFREVNYSMKGEEKKLKFEDGIIQIFNVIDEDESLKLLLSEKFDAKKADYLARHKIRNAEARINQLLFRANIKTDFQKIREIRAKQLELNIVYADTQIKSLNIEFLDVKKVLNCQQKDQTDICTCRL